jgi:hypothetical protein
VLIAKDLLQMLARATAALLSNLHNTSPNGTPLSFKLDEQIH